MADVNYFFINLMHGVIAVHKNNKLKLNGFRIMFDNSLGIEDKIKWFPVLVCLVFGKHFGFIFVATT